MNCRLQTHLIFVLLEQVPIPIVSAEEQDSIIKKVDRIMNSFENISGLYSELDDMIMGLYHLTVQDRKIITAALAGKNLEEISSFVHFELHSNSSIFSLNCFMRPPPI